MTKLRQRIRARWAALRRRGVAKSARFVWDEVRFFVRHGPQSFRGPRQPHSGRHDDGQRAEPVRVAIANHAFSHLPETFRNAPLVDVGCGRGRFLVVALDQGFSPVRGVEVDPDHVLAARQVTRGRADVVVADASTWTVPDDIEVVTMFNPFGEATMADFVANLVASQVRRPRPLAIVYLNPVHVRTVEAGGFTLGWIGEDAAILTAG